MKDNYEKRNRTSLTRRTPVSIRLDGKAFHTYTRGLNKPFDEGLISDMQQTTIFLCQQIQGCKMAYTQSDEISLLLTDYDKVNTQAWFDNEVQKMVSISASFATAEFNRLRGRRFEQERGQYFLKKPLLAYFDSRAFNIPKEDVSNYFVARQRDAVKNSIAMLAQSLYSPKELHKKNGSEMQELAFQKGHNWNDLHWSKKRGSLVVKNTYVNGNLVNVYPNLAMSMGEYEYYPKGCREDVKEAELRVCIEDTPHCWDEVLIEKVRSRWEVVETPMSFVNYFEDNFL